MTGRSIALFAVLSLCAFSLTGCSTAKKVEESTNNAPPTNKAVVGSEATEHYAKQPATLQEGTVDPYTGTKDETNYIGKHPIAEDQTAGEQLMDKANKEEAHH